jgi:leader peptidase (prepilin peptidase) / N-methyltransferase
VPKTAAGSILRQVTVILVIFCALFGLAFGSFLNVCIARLPQHASIVRPASHCPACKAHIHAWDNFPLISWILLRGRCRHCRWSIPVRYPLIEFATAALFLLVYLAYGLTIEGIGAALLCFLLLGLAIMDAETMLLPDAFTLPGIALGVLFCGIISGWRAAGMAILYAIAAAALIIAIRGVYWLVRRREGMGLGDAKLLALIAAWLGAERAALALFLGVVTAALYGLISLSKRRSASPGSLRLPLGSFLCAAAIFSVFLGEQTIKWYLQFSR